MYIYSIYQCTLYKCMYPAYINVHYTNLWNLSDKKLPANSKIETSAYRNESTVVDGKL